MKVGKLTFFTINIKKDNKVLYIYIYIKTLNIKNFPRRDLKSYFPPHKADENTELENLNSSKRTFLQMQHIKLFIHVAKHPIWHGYKESRFRSSSFLLASTSPPW